MNETEKQMRLDLISIANRMIDLANSDLSIAIILEQVDSMIYEFKIKYNIQ